MGGGRRGPSAPDRSGRPAGDFVYFKLGPDQYEMQRGDLCRADRSTGRPAQLPPELPAAAARQPQLNGPRQLQTRRRARSYFHLGSKHWCRIKGSISSCSRKVGRPALGSILFYDFNLFRRRAAKMGVSFHLIPSVKIRWARWKFRQPPVGQQIGTWRNGRLAKWALQKLYISARRGWAVPIQ